MKVKSFKLFGEEYYFTDETRFVVQIGRGHHKYKTKYIIVGEPQVALRAFQALNVHSGYKKRLFVAISHKQKEVLLRRFS